MKNALHATVLLSTIASLAAGCAEHHPGAADNPTLLTDTTGATFGWSCTESGCSLTSWPDVVPAHACDLGWRWSYIWGRYVDVCAICPFETGGWHTWPALCRPVACESDDECPAIAGSPDAWFVCVDGLCQDRSVATDFTLDRHVADELCYRDVPREDTAAIEPYEDPRQQALNETCPHDGATCELSPECSPM